MSMNKKVVGENQELRSLLNLAKQTEAEMTKKLSSYSRQLRRLQPDASRSLAPSTSAGGDDLGSLASEEVDAASSHEEAGYEPSGSLFSSDGEGTGPLFSTPDRLPAIKSRGGLVPEKDDDSIGEASLISMQSTLSSVVVGRNHHGLLMRSIGVQATYTAVSREDPTHSLGLGRAVGDDMTPYPNPSMY